MGDADAGKSEDGKQFVVYTRVEIHKLFLSNVYLIPPLLCVQTNKHKQTNPRK